ncbi:MAG: hypothetical protein G3M70_11720 [Candidatus Nitronauta litoralis]|uniref:PepSY domain-containing protein n=1 Tax=Candidatus Nitronauta litoralis TaxID=2705533 RepID=A0A7T0BX15_9BACT|nr:MAG: hypothetical protein G3M70_11720 [Candidatus Nitronauta litoralis]
MSLVTKGIVRIHRWFGVILCLFFAGWFASGAVLLYVPFPSLSDTERWDYSQLIDSSRIHISPAEAIESGKLSTLNRLRIIGLGERGVYVLEPNTGPVRAVWADNGELVQFLKKDLIVNSFSSISNTPVTEIEGPIEFDQWIVHHRFNSYRPFYKLKLNDPGSEEIYYSQRTGEPMQQTFEDERFWGYLGAVIHWIYPTILRKHHDLWSFLVWWLSLAGIAMVLSGLWTGFSSLWNQRRKSNSLLNPYKGWLKWHQTLGILGGVVTLTWIFSGWLSMDHGRLFSSPTPSRFNLEKFRGLSLDQAVSNISSATLRGLGSFKEAQFFSVDGKVYVLIRTENKSKLLSLGQKYNLVPSQFSEKELVSAVKKGWSGFEIKGVYKLDKFDRYTNLREGSLPPKTLRVEINDPEKTWVHVDMETGALVSVMDQSRRAYRWLYNGLHSFDFPGFSNHRPVWDIVIISFLILGFSLSVTGVVVGWKKLWNSRRIKVHSSNYVSIKATEQR